MAPLLASGVGFGYGCIALAYWDIWCNWCRRCNLIRIRNPSEWPGFPRFGSEDKCQISSEPNLGNLGHSIEFASLNGRSASATKSKAPILISSVFILRKGSYTKDNLALTWALASPMSELDCLLQDWKFSPAPLASISDKRCRWCRWCRLIRIRNPSEWPGFRIPNLSKVSDPGCK